MLHTEPVLWFLIAIVYGAFTLLFMRTNELTGIYRWLFSFGVVPVFIILMIANIWIADHIFPNLFGSYQRFAAFFGTSLIPIAVCWKWYSISVRLSRDKISSNI